MESSDCCERAERYPVAARFLADDKLVPTAECIFTSSVECPQALQTEDLGGGADLTQHSEDTASRSSGHMPALLPTLVITDCSVNIRDVK